MKKINILNNNKMLPNDGQLEESAIGPFLENLVMMADRKKSFVDEKKTLLTPVKEQKMHSARSFPEAMAADTIQDYLFEKSNHPASDDYEPLVTPRIIGVFKKYNSGEISQEQFLNKLDKLKRDFSRQACPPPDQPA